MSGSPASSLVEGFRQELRRADVVSFDVFDTLVCRPGLFSPKDLFYLLEDDVAATLGREVPDFVRLRIQAERDARVRAWGRGVQEVGIRDIYLELGRRLGVAGERLDRLIQAELDKERSSLTTLDLGKALLEVARQEGRKVVFVSDTYFAPAFLEEILQKCGYQDPRPLYASSEYGKTKDDGSLYRLVLAELDLEPDRLLHVGDNVHSDFDVPLGLGIRSFPLPTDKGRLRSLAGIGDVPSGHSFSSAILSDVSERYWAEAPGPKGTAGRSTVRLALLCLAFAIWVTRKVEASGCRTVYFASRDGRIMRRFFDLAARACGIEVESRYLYVSRMALYPSLIFSDPDVARELLAHSWDGLSVSAALKRMALSHDRCRPVLDRHGLAEPEEILDAGATERFSRFLGDVWPLVVRGNERRYRRARSYLEQEGVMSAEPAAFVDIGWHGSLQNCLVKLLGHLGVEKKLEGYYLATFQKPPGAAPDFLAEGYLLEKDEPRWLSALVRSSPSLLEILHGADHGGVLGYRRKLRKIVPVLENDREEQRQFKRSIQPLQEAAFELASELLNRHRNAGVRALPPDLVGRIALSLLYQPDAEEARVFGRLKHAADFGGRRRSLTGELEFDLSRLPGIQFQDGTFPLWPAGSRVMKNLSLSRADRAET